MLEKRKQVQAEVDDAKRKLGQQVLWTVLLHVTCFVRYLIQKVVPQISSRLSGQAS